jgi:hypothetical protein
MKVNKWTLGLAAVGLVSLTPGLYAQTAAAPAAMPATTISGYVDTSMVWNPGTGNANPAPYSFNAGKQDGFNLDSVDVKIAKPLDESQWAAGYTVELMYGPDSALSADAPIRQAFVTMRTPTGVGNGIDWQLGQWDNLLGYESSDSYKDPNWTRSYGYSIEPTEHTGLLATYKASDEVTLQLGVANSVTTVPGNTRNASGGTFGAGTYTIESKKGLVSLLTLTAPDSWGSLKGSGLFVGLDYGPGNAFSHGPLGAKGGAFANGVPPANAHPVDKTHLYVGTTIMTPVKGLSFGAAWDTVNNMDAGPVEGYASTIAAYASYKATDKLTFNSRAEYAHGSAFDYLVQPSKAEEAKILAFTETIQYDLWANVISRLEVRWDTSADGSPMFGNTVANIHSPTGFVASKNNDLMVAANVIYKF